MIDWGAIMTHCIETALGGGAVWLFSNVFRLRRDMTAAFRKIRALERELDMSTNEEKG